MHGISIYYRCAILKVLTPALLSIQGATAIKLQPLPWCRLHSVVKGWNKSVCHPIARRQKP